MVAQTPNSEPYIVARKVTAAVPPLRPKNVGAARRDSASQEAENAITPATISVAKTNWILGHSVCVKNWRSQL